MCRFFFVLFFCHLEDKISLYCSRCDSLVPGFCYTVRPCPHVAGSAPTQPFPRSPHTNIYIFFLSISPKSFSTAKIHYFSLLVFGPFCGGQSLIRHYLPQLRRQFDLFPHDCAESDGVVSHLSVLYPSVTFLSLPFSLFPGSARLGPDSILISLPGQTKQNKYVFSKRSAYVWTSPFFLSCH